ATDTGATPVEVPGGAPLAVEAHTQLSGDGRLWAARGGALHVRDPDGRWDSFAAEAFDSERVRRVAGGRGDAVLVATDRSLWLLDPGRPPRRLTALAGIVSMLALADGSLMLTSATPVGGQILEWRDGRLVTRLHLSGARPISLVARESVVWAAFDRYLVALRPGLVPEILGPQDGIGSGGPLLVDKEGSLWLGTFRGLLHFPEPETVAWGDRDGLPSAHARYLALTGEGLWVATWQGLGRLTPSPGGWRGRSERVLHRSPLCADGSGRLLASHEGRLLERRSGRFVAIGGVPVSWEGCGPSPAGGLWLVSPTELFRSDPGAAPRIVPGPPPRPDEQGPKAVLEDEARLLWVSRGATVCRAEAAAVAAGQAARWTCEEIPGAVEVTALASASPGTLWAATQTAGVWSRRGGVWRSVGRPETLASRTILGLVPSRSGGVWVLGVGVALRVVQASSEADWTVLEDLSTWQGLPSNVVEHLLENEDGSLWVTGPAGVVRIPRSARSPALRPPQVVLTDLLVDGRQASLDEVPELPFGRNHLELRFAALSFREPSRLRYRARLRADAPWSASSTRPVLRLLDLGPGTYRAEVAASLDGKHWSPEPALVAFRVHRPWYLRPWAVGLLVLALAAGVLAFHRARLAFLLHGERQRTRIAMDLHDEMGSDLGSIGILAGLLAETDLPEQQRKGLTRQIAQTAQALGAALSEIVWSLRPGAANLEGLAYHVAERGRRLFAGDTVFRTAFPEDWPAGDLSPAVRRAVSGIALEAMHNAARHAGARDVVLGLKGEGRLWRLLVRDDGQGAPTGPDGSGFGRVSMGKRAAEIGARLCWDSVPGGGTSVELLFHPTAEAGSRGGPTHIIMRLLRRLVRRG
ncbi:MAG TPA: histidine kinase, partial [Gemmatimonadales bacterium]|nr:histidine kinase [Gemmatimonadales bacterium]